MTNAPIKDNAREYGPREKITCNLPHGPRQYGSTNGNKVDHVLHDLETALCLRFGGYTATPSLGGWMDGDGNMMHESGTLYTVSYHLRHDESLEPKRDAAIALFVEAGERLGEDWIHIERSGFQAEHRKTAAGDSEYSNVPPTAAERYRSGADGQGFSSQRWNKAANVSKIRQLDKPTRDHINNPGRSAEFVRR